MSKETDNVGLARGTVKLVPYNPAWQDRFSVEEALLCQKLGLNKANIQHVGSTAIPGILAKPIIDIAILVDSLALADVWAKALAEIGYWDKGPQPDMPTRRFFAKGPENKRTIYLHLVTSEEFERLIRFRDSLRADSTLAKEYSDLKQQLATSFANNRAYYTSQKDSFIQGVLRQR